MSQRTNAKPVEVDLGNDRLTLAFDMDAMMMLEDDGYDLSNLEATLKTKPFSTIRYLIFVSSRAKHPSLKKEEIGPMVDTAQLDLVVGRIMKVLEAYMPEVPEEEKKNPPSPPAKE